MSTPTALPAASNAVYPPDFRAVAEQEFLRLLKHDHPHVSLELSSTWLVFYTLKNLTIPPFTEFPEPHPTIDRSLRQFVRCERVGDTLLDYFLGLKSLDHNDHVGFYRVADTVDEIDEIQALDCRHVLALYATFKDGLESTYRQQLANYWTHSEHGVTRRERYIAERKKALLLESAVGVEQDLFTTSQHAMLKATLEQPDPIQTSTLQKYGTFNLALACGDGPEEVLPGAFVLTHAQSLESPALDDNSLGEVLLRTEHQGLEGFESIAKMIDSLGVRFNDATQKRVLLQNLAVDQREKILNYTTAAPAWRLSVMRGNVLRTLFDQQVAKQQTDFSHLLQQARSTEASANEFVLTVRQRLRKAAHLNNALMLDRNDNRVIGSNMPQWWSQVEHEHQQSWIQAGQDYGKAIIQLHYLCANPPTDAEAAAAHQNRWLENLQSLALAQMRMDQVQARTDQVPDAARAWIKAVIDSPNAKDRKTVDGKTIHVDFMTLRQHPLADVMRIAPAGTRANEPLLICTLNAPDSRVFRWYPDEETMREQLLENSVFARYLLRQLPEENRPAECSADQYEQWLKYYRAGETFKHLRPPAAVPSFSFGEPVYVDQGQDYLRTHHDLKQTRSVVLRLRPEVIQKHGSLLGGMALNVAMLCIPSPVLITMAAGVGLFKVWRGFRHIYDGDYHGAAFEFLCATGYLSAAALGKWVINRQPFAALENIHPAPVLARRTSADGEERIGYLMSSEGAQGLPETEAEMPFDATQFRAIHIGDQQYFVKRQPWLFGHCQLYRVDARNPDRLLGEGDYAVENSLGIWRKVASFRNKVSNWLLKQADQELGQLTQNWPVSIEQITPSAKSAFEQNYLLLARTSNAEELPEISDYCEGGSQPINSLLRAGVHTPLTKRFLTQFYSLREYSGPAFRAVMVSPTGLKRLTREIGQVFVDNGVQSASITRWSAEEWSRDEFIRQTASSDSTVVFVIFDASVAKKNLFTAFLGDHVAIPPSTPLQLVASRLVNNRFYVYFKRPHAIPDKLFDLYSGNTELML